MSILVRAGALLGLTLLASGPLPAVAQEENEVEAVAKTTAAAEASAAGVPVFPEAEARPALARAIEAYYERDLPEDRVVEAEAYVTDAPFDEVYGFYGPRMEKGKWGWRHKTYSLEHQARTLAFTYAALRRDREEDLRARPEDHAPLWGDPDRSPEAFSEALDELVAAHPDAGIEVVEGSREVAGSPDAAQVRVTVERPYIDLQTMELVEQTRIQIVRVSKAR